METDIETQANNYFAIKDLGIFIKNIINLSLLIASIMFFAFLIWGGIDWISSGGDKTKYEAARNKITHALIGLGITALAWLFWNLAVHFLGIGVSNNGHLIFHF